MLVAAGNAVSLIGLYLELAFLGRIVVGFGTGLRVRRRSDYIRTRGGTPFLQGVYGSALVLAPVFAIAVVPVFATRSGFARRISQASSSPPRWRCSS